MRKTKKNQYQKDWETAFSNNEEPELARFTSEPLSHYLQMSIPISSISNAKDAIKKIKFNSPEEVSDPAVWSMIMKDVGKWKRYIVYAVKNKSANKDEDAGYILVGGQKRLYAAMKLGLAELPARVITNTNRRLDYKIVTLFYNADFSSMSPFDKGQFLMETPPKYGMTIEEFISCSGLPYGTLRSLISAYKTANSVSPHLYYAYKQERINQLVVNRAKKLYMYGNDEYCKTLTDYLCHYGIEGIKNLEVWIETNTEKIPIRQKILNYINEALEKKGGAADLPYPVYGEQPEEYHVWDNECFFFSEEEKVLIAAILEKTDIAENKKRLFCHLVKDRLIDIDAANLQKINNLNSNDFKRCLGSYCGSSEKAFEYYNMLENVFKKQGCAVSFEKAQLPFLEACNSVSELSTIPEPEVLFYRNLHDGGLNSVECRRFARYIKYVETLPGPVFDQGKLTDIYQNPISRQYLDGFFEYAVRYRKAKEKIKTFFC